MAITPCSLNFWPGKGFRVAVKPEDAKDIEAVAAFIAELKHRRESAGVSQKALAKVTEYTPSYVTRLSTGRSSPARRSRSPPTGSYGPGGRSSGAGRECTRRSSSCPAAQRGGDRAVDEAQLALGHQLVVEHEMAELTYQDGIYTTRPRPSHHPPDPRPELPALRERTGVRPLAAGRAPRHELRRGLRLTLIRSSIRLTA